MSVCIRIISINIYHKDAIGNFCYDLATLYQKNGFNVQLYAIGFDSESPVKPYELLFSETQPDDIIFYNFSIYDPYVEKVANIEAKKIVYFHGITPPDLLVKYQPETAQQCEDGLQQLILLNHFDVIYVNSESTAKQLRKYVQPRLTPNLLPPIVGTRDLLNHIHPLKEKQKIEKKTVLCVGRVVPHKKIEDAIYLLNAFCQRFPEKIIQMTVVGFFHEEGYGADIRALIERLQLSDKVFFKGFVSDDVLIENYLSSDCYLMMSEHEGFGVPLLEALKAEIPILAYAKNSVGEVLGDAGCQFEEKNFTEIAESLHEILYNDHYRKTLLEKQNQRLQKLLAQCDEHEFLKLLS